MLETAAHRYQQVRATTSSPGELLIALYDGVFRFLNGAKVCFEQKQPARAREQLSKAHAILSELYIALDHDAAPELCGQLAALYSFCMDQLRIAGRVGEAARIQDVQRVLVPLREAWTLAVKGDRGSPVVAAE